MKVKFKKVILSLLKYIAFLVVIFLIINHFGIKENIVRYIRFETNNFKFQDLLSVLITIMSIFIGAMITVATILISMYDKRILRLISAYKKSEYLISSIKGSIIHGILSICILAIIYSNLDFNILMVRIIILSILVWSLYNFVVNSIILVRLVIKLLESTFKDNDYLIIEPKLKDKETRN